MRGLTVGAVILFAALAVGLLVLGVAIVLAVSRRHTPLTATASSVAFVVVLGACWFLAAPVVIDGVYCVGSASDGLVPDLSMGADSMNPPACVDLSRQIVGWWSAAVIVAVAGWGLALARVTRSRAQKGLEQPAHGVGTSSAAGSPPLS